MNALFYFLPTLLMHGVLMLCYIGYGVLFYRVASNVSTRLLNQRSELATSDLPLVLTIGFLCIGLLTFVAGQIDCLQQITAYGIALPGLLLAMRFRDHWVPLVQQSWQARLRWSQQSRVGKVLFGIVALLCFAKFLSLLRLGQHGDAYLYNVGLSNSWLRNCRVGLDLSNIFSGFSYTTEHAYHFFHVLTGNEVFQITLAQMTHASFGLSLLFAGFCHIGLSAGSLSRFACAILALTFVLDSAWTYIAFSSKNDVIGAGLAATAIVAALQNRFAPLLLSLGFLFAVKPNYLPILPAAALLWAWQSSKSQSLPKSFLGILACAILSVLVWLPFGMNNFRLTDNPLFPLGSEVFGGPYTPLQTNASIGEYKPFAGSFLDYAGGLFRFFTRDETLIYFTLWSVAGLIVARTRTMLALFVFTVVAVLATQLITQPFLREHMLRHYYGAYFAFGAMALLAMLQLISKLPTLKKQWIGLVITLAPLLANSHTDNYIKDVVAALRAPHLKADLLQRKPMLGLNSEFAKAVASLPRRHGLRALSVANNLISFSKDVEIWWPMMSYPLYQYDWSNMTAQQLRAIMQEHKIDYLIWDENGEQRWISDAVRQEVAGDVVASFQGYRVAKIRVRLL